MKHFLNLLLFKLLHRCRWKIIRYGRWTDLDTGEYGLVYYMQCQDCGEIKRSTER